MAESGGKRCIRRVPQLLRDSYGDDGYSPKLVSIGPYHHGRVHLLLMELHKRRALHNFLQRRRSSGGVAAPEALMWEVVKEVRQLVEAYDGLDQQWAGDEKRFVELMVVDGCFFLELLLIFTDPSVKQQYQVDPFFGNEAIIMGLLTDALMWENQLPLPLLHILWLSTGGQAQDLRTLMEKFTDHPTAGVHFLDEIRKGLLLVGDFTYNKSDARSATQFRQAGVRFHKAETECLSSIKFSGDGGALTLPCITIRSYSETLLLNLIAWENVHNVDFGVTHYVKFMADLIQTTADAALLMESGIITVSEGGEDDVVKLFSKLVKGLTDDSFGAGNEGSGSQAESGNESAVEDDEERILDTAVGKIDLRHMQEMSNKDLKAVKVLGSGGFGTVYHGKWKGNDVAIKRINKSCFPGRQSEKEIVILETFKEAGILSNLQHPNIVSLYGFARDESESISIVMELVLAGSLRNILDCDDKYLDHRKRLLLAKGAASGMDYLHLRNVVHFDLKCDNLLVDLEDPSRPVCKVTDFGLSKVKQNTLISGGFRGTLPYMAPELLMRGENKGKNKVSEKVDVYSFGIVMWEILTGGVPYDGMGPGDIIAGVPDNTLRPPVPASCDPQWRRLMEQCWDCDPKRRPSFNDIARRLNLMLLARS